MAYGIMIVEGFHYGFLKGWKGGKELILPRIQGIGQA